MGWLVSIKETPKGTKYRLWTTISDGWLTEWSTKDEIIKFLFWNKFRKLMEGVLEDAMDFPNGWYDKKNTRRIFDENNNTFHEFMFKGLKVKGKSSDEVLLDKFSEVIDNIGIDIQLSDKAGYGFSSKERVKKLKK
jgi:hypothetical protein